MMLNYKLLKAYCESTGMTTYNFFGLSLKQSEEITNSLGYKRYVKSIEVSKSWEGLKKSIYDSFHNRFEKFMFKLYCKIK